jgi:hypothetical protein
VKYKEIPAMAHNFAHSFLSLMNYDMEHGYLIDLLPPLLRDTPDHTLSVEWLPDPPLLSSPVSSPVEKSIRNYRRRLPEHLEHHRIPISALRSFKTVFSLGRLGLLARVEVVDDRGKLHTKPVSSS